MIRVNRRTFIRRTGTAAMAAAGLVGSRPGGLHGASAAQNPGTGLAETAFRPLPLGAILPTGWLKRQLRIQADGLSGHLDEFWPDVGRSQWFGGDAEGCPRVGGGTSLRAPGICRATARALIDTLRVHQHPRDRVSALEEVIQDLRLEFPLRSR